MEIGERIRELRLQHNLTLEELGNLCGVGKSTVRKWEKGMISDIRQTNLAKLANALGTTPESLMGWNEMEKRIVEEYPLVNQICSAYGTDAAELLSRFLQLNDMGKQKALENIQDLLDVPKYRKED